MDKPIYSALEEWARLESAHHRAKVESDRLGTETADLACSAVSAKEIEILEMRAQTKEGALTHLRFCATFLELNGAYGGLAVGAIRNAASVLSWS